MYLQGVIICKTAGAQNNEGKTKQKPRDLDTLDNRVENCYSKNITFNNNYFNTNTKSELSFKLFRKKNIWYHIYVEF